MAADRDDTRLTPAERRAVARLIKETSLGRAAAQLSVAPQTLRTIAGGVAGRRGTIYVVRRKLAEIEGGVDAA